MKETIPTMRIVLIRAFQEHKEKAEVVFPMELAKKLIAKGWARQKSITKKKGK